MSDYFTRVVGMLKRHNFHFLGQGSGRYEVWQKFSRNVIVPNRCASRLTANGVMKAAGINFIFSENAKAVWKFELNEDDPVRVYHPDGVNNKMKFYNPDNF